MFKGHKEARIYNITLFVTHMLICSLWYNCYIYHFPWDACTTRCWWILLYFSIYGRGTPKIHHNRGKWGLLCKMRTKWGPFQQFGPHEDQVLNWGPFCTHCIRAWITKFIMMTTGTHSIANHLPGNDSWHHNVSSPSMGGDNTKHSITVRGRS